MWATYVSEQLLECLIMLHLSQLRFDGEGETLEELITVAVKHHLARLHHAVSRQFVRLYTVHYNNILPITKNTSCIMFSIILILISPS